MFECLVVAYYSLYTGLAWTQQPAFAGY